LPVAPEQYRLVALGDVRSLPHVWEKVSQRVFSEEKDALFIIGTGDYPADGSKYHEWIEQFFKPARSLLGHMPIWPAIGNHERTRVLLDSDGTPHEWPIDQGRRFLVPLFEMYGVDIVLNGHDHLYERSQKDGIYYVVTGGGGAPLYKINSAENPYQQVAQSVNHYTTLDVESTAITLSAIDADGRIIDWFKVPLAAHLPTEKKPAWRGGVYADLQVSFVGDDHGLPVEVDIGRELVLAEPGYDVVAMETPTIDGSLDEWGSLTPIRIDSESPHITNAEGYRGDEDFHAQVFLGWSSQGLHMAIEVLDDVQRSIWMTDSVELFVDGRAEAERGFVGNGSWSVDAIEWKVSSSA
jgi:predicted phosphodiesterase